MLGCVAIPGMRSKTASDWNISNWINSGTSRWILKIIIPKMTQFPDKVIAGETDIAMKLDISKSNTLDTEGLLCILVQAGYLTVHDQGTGNKIIVGFPNNEVALNFYATLGNMIRLVGLSGSYEKPRLSECLERFDFKELGHRIRHDFNALTYLNVPAKQSSVSDYELFTRQP
jgi:hypothetical protein